MKINARNSPLFAQGLAKWRAFVEAYTGPYDFSLSVYAGMNQKVAFVCATHGVVQSDAKNLMAGKQCQQCVFDTRRGKTRVTTSALLRSFRAVHGDLYDYSEVAYTGQRSQVVIRCRSHGVFTQLPGDHARGAGCPTCFHEDRRGAAQRMEQAEFELRVSAALGGLISAAGVPYTNSQTDIYVTCTKHGGQLRTRANWLLNGCNPCPRCNHMKSSGEQQVRNFLAAFTSVQARNRSLIKPKELDIFLPEHNLAVEYCGMFWHSHGDAESERKDKHNHFTKHTLAAAKGVRLLTLYESEWHERKTQVCRLLRAAIGKLRGRLLARKCELRSVTTQQANAFFDRYHIQGGTGSGVHYGLYWNDKLVACMRFTFGGNDRGAQAKARTWTLSRYATRVNVVGGASRLFTAFLREHTPSEVKSFSDNRLFSGATYTQLGFTLQDELGPDYQVWSPKVGLKPKPHYQRRNLQARLQDHGMDEPFDAENDARTEAEMTYLMGARRIYDCGKKRWVWTVKTNSATKDAFPGQPGEQTARADDMQTAP